MAAQRLAQRLAQLGVRVATAELLQPQHAGRIPMAVWRLEMLGVQPQCPQQLHSGTGRPESATQASAPDLERKALLNRMLYRSRQRGFLELDLIVGMWAEKELPRMSTELMREFEVVLEQENPDMFKWLTGQAPPPQELQRNRAFRALQSHVKAMTDKHHSVPQAAGSERKEWVRGWSDTGRDLSSGGTSSSAGSSSADGGS